MGVRRRHAHVCLGRRAGSALWNRDTLERRTGQILHQLLTDAAARVLNCRVQSPAPIQITIRYTIRQKTKSMARTSLQAARDLVHCASAAAGFLQTVPASRRFPLLSLIPTSRIAAQFNDCGHSKTKNKMFKNLEDVDKFGT